MPSVTLVAPAGASFVQSAGAWKLTSDAGYLDVPPAAVHALRVSGFGADGSVSVPSVLVEGLLACGFTYPDPSAATVGEAGGVAGPLDEDGLLPTAQIPPAYATLDDIPTGAAGAIAAAFTAHTSTNVQCASDADAAAVRTAVRNLLAALKVAGLMAVDP